MNPYFCRHRLVALKRKIFEWASSDTRPSSTPIRYSPSWGPCGANNSPQMNPHEIQNTPEAIKQLSASGLTNAERWPRSTWSCQGPPSKWFFWNCLSHGKTELMGPTSEKGPHTQSSSECWSNDWKVLCEPVEIQCRGFAGHLLPRTLKLLGVKGLQPRWAIKNILEAAERALWSNRSLGHNLGIDHPQLGCLGEGVWRLKTWNALWPRVLHWWRAQEM